MKKILLGSFLIMILFPTSSAFSQLTETEPALSVALASESPYVYQDDEGYTIVVGNVENKNPLTSVTNVKIRAVFYDAISANPLEIVQGETILQVIPSLGISPYMIKSSTPNPQISHVDVFLETFDSSTSKSKLMSLKILDTFFDENLVVSGILKNGPAPVNDTNVYLSFYDAFKPSRVLSVSTISIGDMAPSEQISFEFDDKINPRSVGFTIFSESNIFYSDILDVEIPEPEILTKLVTISDVVVTDSAGNNTSEIKLGSTVKIKSNSWVELSPDHSSSEVPYTYYVQVKESGDKPFVEYIGKYDGRYIGEGEQSQAIDWIPERKGLFFIETFVWDRNNVPIAAQGPIVIILVS